MRVKRKESNCEKKIEKNKKEKFLDFMDMPVELLQDTYRITMVGKQTILLEKYQSILEYDENIIRFSCGVTFPGLELSLEEINENEIFITGKLVQLELE